MVHGCTVPGTSGQDQRSPEGEAASWEGWPEDAEVNMLEVDEASSDDDDEISAYGETASESEESESSLDPEA